MKADPTTEIPWNEVESGHWEARCLWGVQDFHEAPADRRTRLDPLDPSTSRHAPQCEHRNTTDPTVLQIVLKVQVGAHPNYWWVTGGVCETSWQVRRFAKKVS